MDVRRGLIVGATLGALALPSAAAAALEVRLAIVPAAPKTGARAVVRVRPYWTYLRPDGSCCKLVSADVNYPFKIEAVSPGGRATQIRVRRSSDRYIWVGSFTFRRPGRWTVRAPQWGPRYSTHYGARPRIRFRVLRSLGTSHLDSGGEVPRAGRPDRAASRRP